MLSKGPGTTTRRQIGAIKKREKKMCCCGTYTEGVARGEEKNKWWREKTKMKGDSKKNGLKEGREMPSVWVPRNNSWERCTKPASSPDGLGHKQKKMAGAATDGSS